MEVRKYSNGKDLEIIDILLLTNDLASQNYWPVGSILTVQISDRNFNKLKDEIMSSSVQFTPYEIPYSTSNYQLLIVRGYPREDVVAIENQIGPLKTYFATFKARSSSEVKNKIITPKECNHQWKFYQGLHMESFHYCTICDKKHDGETWIINKV